MEALVPSGATLLAFLAASLVLAVVPGPVVVYVVARTLAQGRRAGLASVLGAALGNLGNAVGASLGLAALFAVSSLAFSVVKFAGAAYLIWLGVAAFCRRDGPARLPRVEARGIRRLLRDGFLVGLLNPKTALFFAAFLPQFIDPAKPAVAQSLILSVLFVAVAATTDSAYAVGASVAARLVGRSRRAPAIGCYVTAATFIGLGLYTAASGTRSAR